jgi:multidrug transporter EmrE-like cation transporter
MSLTDIVFLSVVEVFGDFNLRWYAETNKPVFLGAGILGYVGVVYWLIVSLRSYNVLYVNGMWDGVSTLIESVAAYYVLGDRLDNAQNYLGLVLVIVGILLLKK